MSLPNVVPVWFLVAIALEIAIVLAIAALGTRALTQARASARHVVWTTALLTILLMPFATMLPLSNPFPVTISLPAPLAVPATSQTESSTAPQTSLVVERGDTSSSHPTPPRPIPWRTIFLSVYGVGVAFVLFRFALGSWQAFRFHRQSLVLEDHHTWHRTWATVHAGRKAPSRSLRVSEEIQTPVGFGVFRPVVLLPASAAGWTEADRRSALIHEMAHAERGDWAIQFLATLACALYWFHPLVWFAARRLHLEAERACDEQVLLAGMEPEDYAQQLVDLTRQHQCRPLRTAVALASGHELTDRIHSILEAGRKPMEPRHATTTLAVLGVIAGLLLAPLAPTQASSPDHPQWHRSRPSAGRDWTDLMRAAYDGDTGRVESLLDAGEDVDEDVGHQVTALILACSAGHPDIVHRLLEAGADPDHWVQSEGWRDRSVDHLRSALGSAARHGHLDSVRALVEAGARIDRSPPGDATALMEAAENGHLDIVEYLIQQGSDVNRRVDGDGTALIAAARGGDLDILKRLVDAGADVNLGVAGDGNALITAVRDGDRDMVEYLLEQGADPNAYVPGDETAMAAAAEAGDERMMRALLDAADSQER